MDNILNIVSSAATSNPALYVLRQKGYELEVTVAKDGKVFYEAQKDFRRFDGQSGPEVLGLVSIWEGLGDDWLNKATEIPDILAEVIVDVEE